MTVRDVKACPVLGGAVCVAGHSTWDAQLGNGETHPYCVC